MTLPVVLSLLAIWRLARLVAVDEITRPIREGIANRSDWLGYLVTCPWCISIWLAPLIAVPTVMAIGVADPAWWAILLVLCGSGVAGIMQSIEDRLDR